MHPKCTEVCLTFNNLWHLVNIWHSANIWWTFTSGQDGITGTRFTLLPETIRSLDKIYAINSFQTLDIQQFKMVIPEGWETNHVSPGTAPAYCLERISRPWAGMGPRRGLLELRRWTGRWGATGVHRQCERRMNSESVEGSPGAFRGGRISRLPQAGLNHLNGLEITAPTLLQGGE